MKLNWLFFLAAVALSVASVCAEESPALVQLPPVQRERVADRPLVFPRIRTIYNLYQNPYQNFNECDWIDRPLLHDRSLADLDSPQRDLENYKRQLQMAMNYGVNGLSDLYHGAHFQGRFNSMADAADAQYDLIHNQIHLDILGNVLREGPKKAADIFEPVLRRYMACRGAARIGDKVVVCSYGADYVSPADLAAFINILKERCGDRFWFVASIGTPKGKRLNNWPTFQHAFTKFGYRLPADEVEGVKAYLRSYLDVCDGLLMNNCNHLDTLDDQLDQAFYEQFVVPLFSGVLSEPPYRGKLLALSASLGYINHIAGGTQQENGTRTLRESLRIALDAPADIIIMPEWNELNENTNLEPTVNRSFSTQRIMRYFMARSGKNPNPLTPLASDDLSVPNLIVSARAAMALGEIYYVELLNVPDGSGGAKPFSVDCEIRDETGRVVRKVESLTFAPGQLMEHRVEIPSELVTESRTLHPFLTIRTGDGRTLSYAEGLPITRLDPSWNTNLICLKQPLRDLAAAKAFDVQAIPTAGGMDFKVNAATQQDDPIRHLEILEDDTVVYSYDAAPPYTLSDGDMLLHLSYSSKKEINPFPMKISVTGGEIRYFQDRLRLGDPRESKNMKKGPDVLFNWKSNVNRRGGILVISNQDKAVLDITTPAGDLHVPLSRVAALGTTSFNLPETVAICMESADRALDIPAPIRRDHADFHYLAKPRNVGAVYRVRLITMSGKMAMKGPYLLPETSRRERTMLNVFSESAGKAVPISVAAARVPVFHYDLTRQDDAILRTDMGKRWFGAKAQGWSYGGAMASSSLPGSASLAEPQKIVEDGAPALLFDGKDDYLSFPSEVIPARGSFTIEFEIKPLSLGRQYLVRSQNSYPDTVDILLDNGKVVCTYRGEVLKSEAPYFNTVTFSSPRQLKVNEWTKIRLSYNLKEFQLTLGDDPPVIHPYDRLAWWRFSPFTFGGSGPESSAYFHGYLRSLVIAHGAPVMSQH